MRLCWLIVVDGGSVANVGCNLWLIVRDGGSVANAGCNLRLIRCVVLMGMGEFVHNLDNVFEVFDLLGSEGDLNIKNFVFFIVGDWCVFE